MALPHTDSNGERDLSPTLSNLDESRPGVQSRDGDKPHLSLLPLSGVRLGRPSMGRTQRSSGIARFMYVIGNDPSAGSPTETLLQLLLPLNDHAWSLFQRTYLLD